MRFYIISEHLGLLTVTNDSEYAEQLALIAAVNTGHTVYLHDREDEK